ncbi:LEAF RUST 10 DISEASE-RESISTANCE LOCUS RECEPTOR-LIKE PROTEIN KINASE-like 2.1 isoform X2 [Olea europaea var. sylvestris]|uniref:LEAF RUST 10 DISEASE-RESISTANCE LOCUS RECEPTOR-LIKE PROTEIN KINASE-like 2.1 isoform X2 n=1 Tax=Olea europaea var. sylvestris TaxID=158386 RepID=UPI000C1D146F|nr:LEAF RUST 10 DISEASE-RESISTANCE LOCUS RECEPTOR-LIKE PROTEIN KINASE-like 2.1 isoform X2 [Olea europaea var. sylvestris]
MYTDFLYILSLFIITTLVLLYIPGSLCQNGGEYASCGASFQCAGIREISYPFFGGNRPEYCGYPGFQLSNCQGDVPILTISSRQYRVLEINNFTKTVRVSREDLWNIICPRFLYNTTLEQNIFLFSPNYPNVTLHYGCSTSSGQPAPRSPHMFNCTVNGTNSENLFTIGEDSPSIPGFETGIRCETNISVPVNQTAARLLAASSASIVLLQDALASGFSLQWSANNIVCENCIRSGGVCGTNRDSLSFACYCTNGTFASICNSTSTGNNTQTGTGNGVSLGIPSIIASSIIIFCYLKRQCSSWESIHENNRKVETFLLKHGSLAPKIYNYSEIKNITKSFSNKLGQGGYGSVYKGMLPNGRFVAVKVLNEVKGSGEDFMNEVGSISRTSHVNIVNLLGFCYERNRRALVYEFMPNKSLDKLMYKSGSPNSEGHLEWKTLYQIALGVAQGLEYLHGGCNTRIIHFDIKPQNILLDEDFCPKISDFGLAKLCGKKQSILSTVGTRGTIGYIAPEVFCRNFGGMSYKSDIYSYGMMVLEMAGAKKIVEVGSTKSSENYFTDQVYELIVVRETMKFDEFMSSEDKETARKMFLVGFWCIQTTPSDRPSMTKVIEMLKGSFESIEIPPKPFLFSPRMPVQDFSSSLSTYLDRES